MTEATVTQSTKGAATYTPGAFVWHELGTSDVAKAEKFYTELFGWTVQQMPMGPDSVYRMFFQGETGIGGMYALDPKDGIPSNWTPTVSVVDVDATAKAVVSAGGKVLAGPSDVPDMVRYAVFADAQGAVFGVCRSVGGDPANDMPKPGEFCWDQLNTTDMDSAGTFYNKVIGWSLERFEQVGGYTFKFNGQMEASVDNAPAGVPPHWLSHIAVANLAATQAKLEKLGGKVLMGQIPVPTMGTFSVVQDAVGATFCLFEGAQG